LRNTEYSTNGDEKSNQMKKDFHIKDEPLDCVSDDFRNQRVFFKEGTESFIDQRLHKSFDFAAVRRTDEIEIGKRNLRARLLRFAATGYRHLDW
jgi:hypothetical protein